MKRSWPQGLTVAFLVSIAVLSLACEGGSESSPTPTPTAPTTPAPEPTPPTPESTPTQVGVDELVTVDVPPQGERLMIDTAQGPVFAEQVFGDCVDGEGVVESDALVRIIDGETGLILCVAVTDISMIEDPNRNLTLYTWLCNEYLEKLAFYITRGDLPDESGDCQSFDG